MRKLWRSISKLLRKSVVSMMWFIIGLLIFIFQIMTILILEFRNPSKTVAWLLILFIFPIIGFVVYYFMAKEYKQRRIVRRRRRGRNKDAGHKLLRTRTQVLQTAEQLRNPDKAQQTRLFSLLQNMPESPITMCNETTVLTNASVAYEAMFEAIEGAKDTIHLEYYTIRSDQIGMRFQAALLRKALQGVKVRIIYDGVGSYKLDSKFIKPLREAGVELYSFLPPFIAFFDKRMNYRNHRKITVVDGRIGFLGGINIGDEYLGKDRKLGYWRDTVMQIRGDAVFFLQHTFLKDWLFVSNHKLDGEQFFPAHSCLGNEQVQIITSGPDEHWDTILEMYFSAITTATKRVYITTPYFIPDRSIQMALKTAAISGVDVRIIFPKVTDSSIVRWASLSYLEELLQVGVRFYQYTHGFIHAKVLICDHFMASVGTANMDMRSFFSNFELNAVMFDEKTIERLVLDFHKDMQKSKETLLSEFEKRSRFLKAKEVLCRMLSPLL